MKTKYAVNTADYLSFCPVCGEQLERDGNILKCPNCGTAYIETSEEDEKHGKQNRQADRRDQ